MAMRWLAKRKLSTPEHRLHGIDDLEVDHRVHVDGDVVLGDDRLGRDVDHLDPERHLYQPVDNRDAEDHARALGLGTNVAEPEEHRPLVLGHHPDRGRQHDEDEHQGHDHADHDADDGPRARQNRSNAHGGSLAPRHPLAGPLLNLGVAGTEGCPGSPRGGPCGWSCLGSSGLIGRALAAALRVRGDTVVALVRRPPAPGEVRYDPVAGTIDAEGLAGADAVVHLAGAGLGDKRWSSRRRHEIVDSRIDSTALLARTLRAMADPPAVLVNASAVGFYGDRGDEELTEQSTPGTGFLAELCQQWEEATDPPPPRAGCAWCGSAPASSCPNKAVRSPASSPSSAWAWAAGSGTAASGSVGSPSTTRSASSCTPSTTPRFAVRLTPPPLRRSPTGTSPGPWVGRCDRPPSWPCRPPPCGWRSGPSWRRRWCSPASACCPSAITASGYRFRHADLDGALAAALAPGTSG